MKNLKISKELEWVRPYLEKVQHLVPVARLPKLRALHAKPDKIHHFRAVTWKDEKTDEIFSIAIYLYVYRTEKLKPHKRKKQYYSKIDILTLLAHELAHMNHWNHTPAHKMLEDKVSTVFMKLLEKEGYVSEEYEMKHEKPKY